MEEETGYFFPAETTGAVSGFAGAVCQAGLSWLRQDAQGCCSVAAALGITWSLLERSMTRLLAPSGAWRDCLNFFKEQIIVILSDATCLAAEQEPVGKGTG